jgi:hypothetical protein
MNKLFNFKYSRQFLGIFIVFMGSPLIFFFKEVLGFSGGSTFTIASFMIGFALMVSPNEIFRKFYKPNIPMFRMAGLFLAVALMNFFLFNPYYGFYGDRYVFYRDFGNFSFIFIFFFLLLGVSNEVKNYFLPIVVSLTFLGSICLIYSMATNPLFVIGQRASVVFGDGSTTASGNPHVYARNAFAGVFSSYLLLRTRHMLWKIFSLINLALSVIVLILAQARSILLAFLFALCLFLYYNVSGKTLKNAVAGAFKPQNLLLIVFTILSIIYFISTQANLVAIINLYYDTFLTTFTKALLTASGMQDEQTIDYSSMGRINSFAEFKKIMLEEPWLMILGNGFRYKYMDIPILETLIDCGVVAFVSFSLMNYLIFREAIRAIKEGTNPLTTFLGYFYMSYFIGLFTGGEPYGTPYWFIFLVMIRFLGIRYIEKIPMFKPNPIQEPTPVTTI